MAPTALYASSVMDSPKALVVETRLRRSLPPPAQRRRIRELAGHTQERVAAALGVSRVTVGRWEAGVRLPRGQQLRRYALLLDQLAHEVYREPQP